MKNISGYIFKGALLLLLVQSLQGQDTLRTYGPRIGIDLARFVYYFTDPPEVGAEFSLDFEIYKNFFPVFEAGYSHLSDAVGEVEYASGGPYARVGVDYNLLPMKDRSVHHSIFVGFRYATSIFSHQSEGITIQSDYWGDLVIDTYENTLQGHWLELVGGIKAEVASNLFLGWSVRYKILLNPDMDPQVAPLMIPGFGRGTEERGFGFTYSIFYKIPLIKR
ncbi:MAG: hypothetical protein KAT15_08135 [Bacteroidales bacterium]|nr:hypothetical protein [Bacteroidales bacterium]